MISIYLGKRKVVPSANPSIIWEGFFGAAFITTIISYFIYPYEIIYGYGIDSIYKTIKLSKN
ncbi:MAG: hypothetical protein ACQEWV_19445 [Bacillota bacterium]